MQENILSFGGLGEQQHTTWEPPRSLCRIVLIAVASGQPGVFKTRDGRYMPGNLSNRTSAILSSIDRGRFAAKVALL